MSLGDIELRRSDHDTARQRYEEALPMYQKIHETYSIGMTCRQLARLNGTVDGRANWVEKARDAWAGIDRKGLLDELVDELEDN
jgi:hypothetical protein